MKFYVDGEECPDTNGVGVETVGGVFNCGLFGTSFEVRCTEACEPQLSLAQVFLWKERAVTIEGAAYSSDAGYGCSSSWPIDDNNLLFTTGSCWHEFYSSMSSCYCALSSTLYEVKRVIGFTFDTMKVIKKVVFLSRTRSP